MGNIAEDYRELWAACGRRALEGFGRFEGRQSFEIKEDQSLVTETDKAVESLLGEEFDQPNRGIRMIGEETVDQRGEEYIQQALNGSVWVVDPIDGTAPFANGFTQWGISAARGDGGVLTEGLLFFPAFPKEDGANLFWSSGGKVWSGRLDSRTAVLEETAPLPSPKLPWNGGRMISLSQKMARRGRVDVSNPVQSNGACIYSLWGLMTGRYGAYLGDFKLWDAAAGWVLASALGIKGIFMDEQAFATDIHGISRENLLPFNSSLGEDGPYRLRGNGRWHVRGPVIFYTDPAAREILAPLLLSAADPAGAVPFGQAVDLPAAD